MKNTPVNSKIVSNLIKQSGFPSVGRASIRELVRLVSNIEEATGIKFVRMEMGVPGLKPNQVGVEAEIEALKNDVASIYPMIEGIPVLKTEIARFAKLFLNIDVNPVNCIPTVGSMQGAMAAFMVAGRCDPVKDTTLFIDPGFPVQKQQHHVLGLKYETFDVYDYRGEKLRDKIESYFSRGNISSVIYSNPNNPSWICFTPEELEIIGSLAQKYGVIVIEDLAYFGMDFRKNYGIPGKPPYQPSVANYTSDYILLISSSKAFSYAGQRISSLLISDDLFPKKYTGLKRFFTSDIFGHATIYGALYSLSAGTSHSAQYALHAMLKAVNDGNYNFVDGVREYEKRATVMKQLFTENGFHVVYDKDIDEPVADGFYFTIAYPGFNGADLLQEMLYYGISAISLEITGSSRKEGLRACVSQVGQDQFPDLEDRLRKFREDHPVP